MPTPFVVNLPAPFDSLGEGNSVVGVGTDRSASGRSCWQGTDASDAVRKMPKSSTNRSFSCLVTRSGNVVASDFELMNVISARQMVCLQVWTVTEESYDDDDGCDNGDDNCSQDCDLKQDSFDLHCDITRFANKCVGHKVSSLIGSKLLFDRSRRRESNLSCNSQRAHQDSSVSCDSDVALCKDRDHARSDAVIRTQESFDMKESVCLKRYGSSSLFSLKQCAYSDPTIGRSSEELVMCTWNVERKLASLSCDSEASEFWGCVPRSDVLVLCETGLKEFHVVDFPSHYCKEVRMPS